MNNDRKTVRSLLSTLGEAASEVNIKRIYRLGAARGSKPRPLKIVLASTRDQSFLLSSESNLSRLDDDHAFRRVYVKSDLTSKQLVHQRHLRREFRMRQEGGENVIIQAGRIVSRDSSPSSQWSRHIFSKKR